MGDVHPYLTIMGARGNGVRIKERQGRAEPSLLNIWLIGTGHGCVGDGRCCAPGEKIDPWKNGRPLYYREDQKTLDL